MKTPEKLLQIFNEKEKDVFLFFIWSPQPVSIDALNALSAAPAVVVLKVMEELKRRRLASEAKRNRGLYSLIDVCLPDLITRHTSAAQREEALKKIIAYQEQTHEDGRDKILVLADLFCKLGFYTGGLGYMKNAAEMLARSGQKEMAVRYYDDILKHFSQHSPAAGNVGDFLDAALGKVSILKQFMPVTERVSLLEKARTAAKRYGAPDRLARIELALGTALQMANKHKEASRCIDEGWRLAEETGDRDLIKWATLEIGSYLHWKGRFSEAVDRYESAVGNLEEFGDNEETLWGVVLLGYTQCVCGRVSRGMGMIETAQAKAKILGLHGVVSSADFMKALCFLEMRRVSDAEAILNSLSPDDDKLLDHLVLWGINEGKAYVHCMKGEYEKAFEYQNKGYEYSRLMGWEHHPGTWTFEYRDILESHGFVHEKTCYDLEIKKMLTWDDIYMKGVALYYQALRNMKKAGNTPSVKVLPDLQASEQYLREGGAEIALARTRIALGDYYLKKGGTKRARSYLEKAWAAFSKIDKDLFPVEMLNVLTQEQKIEFMIDRIIKINRSLGAIRDRSAFLEQVLNVAIDFATAMHGAFFTFEPGGKLTMAASRNIDPLLIDAGLSKQFRARLEEITKKGAEYIFPDQDVRQHVFHGILSTVGIRSFIVMPVALDKNIEGCLCLGNRLNGEPFSDNQLSYIRLLCSLIAVGLANIGMYEELKSRFVEKEDEAGFYKKQMGIASPANMVIGDPRAAGSIIDQISQVAPTDSSVLILGETGVGKELAAKTIHNLSARRNGPFIAVNLATLPQDLVASELFGHEKGAFTGANERQKGRFELADGGTIFLDEIGDLPPGVQVKLLRVLQEGTFERLGSAKPLRSDFRVIAATHKDLRIETERGSFRQDLFYRLNVFPLHIPPLRDRREDIPPLTRHFLDMYARKMGKRIGHIPKEELKKLMSYHWPGNVRELKHFIERAVILSDGHGIRFSGLDHIPGDQAVNNGKLVSLAELEKDHIERVLASTLWRIQGPRGASTILGLKPTTLLARMKKLGIARPEQHIKEDG